jgi:outer membrane protein TolC
MHADRRIPAVRLLFRAGALALGAGGLCAMSACSTSPLDAKAEADLKRAVRTAASRELAEAQKHPQAVTLTRDQAADRLDIRPQVREELDKMAGAESYTASPPPLSNDLLNEPSRTVMLSLERAIRSTVSNNIAVQFARLSPAISEAQVVTAEAAFDWVLFANTSYNNTDQPTVRGIGVGNSSQAINTTGGLRKQLVGGGRFTVQQEFNYTQTRQPSNTSPTPANSLAYVVQYDQPLLRNGGSEVALAEIRLARNAERNAVQTLKRDLIRTVGDTERAYWQLVQAYREIQILQRLLERGVQVRDQIVARRGIDANQAAIGRANSTVESRKADVLRAQTNLRLVSDRLKQLMNDPDVPVGSEVILIPADRAVDEPVKFSLVESLRSAVQYRPEVQLAILAIDDATIRRMVAENARLPDLSLRLQTRVSGLNDSPNRALGDVVDAGFVDYIAGLVFEQPIGNRRAEADLRRRSLERMQSVVAYRNTVQQVIGEVKSALDRMVLNYRLTDQTKASRVAAADSLRVLLVEKQTNQAYTVERLDLELREQENLAQAERQEVGALIDYNTAMVDLFASMGTLLERNRIEFVVPTPLDALRGGDWTNTTPIVDWTGGKGPESDLYNKRRTP